MQWTYERCQSSALEVVLGEYLFPKVDDLISPKSILRDHVLKLVVGEHDLVRNVLEIPQRHILRLALSSLLFLLLMLQNAEGGALAEVKAVQHRAQLLLTLK